MIDLDLNGALNNLGGSIKLYRMLASGFIEKYSLIDQEINVLLQKSEMEEARRMVHSMKGLGGNLGAIEFVNTTKELEKDILQYSSGDVSALGIECIIQTSWLAFSVALKRVLKMLKELLLMQDEQILDL